MSYFVLANDGMETTVIDIDNIRIDGNTISSTNSNGDINITPDGTGNVVIESFTFDDDTISSSGTNDIQFAPGGNDVVPHITATHNLGTVSKRWNSLNAVTGDFSGSMTIGTDLSVTGNLTVSGTTVTLDTEQVIANSHLILINDGETGAGVTEGFAGIEVDRGTLTNYRFVFNETKDCFETGEIGDLQCVATREDTPTNDALTHWNSTLNRLDTDANLTWDGTSLSVTGRADIDNVRIDGNSITSSNTNGDLTIDANGTGNILASADFIPDSDVTHDLGASDACWNNIYVSTVNADNFVSKTSNGNVTINPNGTGNIVADATLITEHVYPDTDCSRDLGDSSLRYRDLHLCRGLVLGDNHTISAPDTTDRHIVTGESHTLSGTNPVNIALVGGAFNSVTADSDRSGIFCGNAHVISSTGDHNVIIGGISSEITAGDSQTIIGGSDHSISDPDPYNVIIGGSNASINNSVGSGRNGIIIGQNHNIGGSTYSGIFGGSTGNIFNSTSSVILGGATNEIVNTSQNSILVGTLCDITATGGAQNVIIGTNAGTMEKKGSLNIQRSAMIAGNTNIIAGGEGVAFLGGENGNISADFAIVLKCNTTSRTYTTSNRCYIDAPTTVHYGDIDPDTTSSHDIGSSSLCWDNIFVDTVNTGALTEKTGGSGITVTGNLAGNICGNVFTNFIFEKVAGNDINIEGNVLPLTSGGHDIGSTSKRWANVYAEFGVFGTSTVTISQGRIFNSTGNLDIDSTGNVIIDATNNLVLPGSDDADDLGASDQRWRDVRVSRGLVLGDNHTISAPSTTDRHIVTGESHTLSGTNPVNIALVGGAFNSVTADSDRSGIFCGNAHVISSTGDNNVIMGGVNNIITENVTRCSVIGGALGNISGNGVSSIILAGNNNKIDAVRTGGTNDGSRNAILVGNANRITGTTECSTIIGGVSHILEDTYCSSIIGGTGGNVTGNTVVVLKCTGGPRDYTVNNQCYIDAETTVHYGDIDPDTTDTHDLGSSSLRWGNVYAEFGVFGTSTVTISQGRIFNSTGNLDIDSTGNVIIDATNNLVLPGSDDADDFGASDQRWRDFRASRGIVLGDSHTISAPSTTDRHFILGSGCTLSGNVVNSCIIGTTNTINGGNSSVIILGGTSNSITGPITENDTIIGGSGNQIINDKFGRNTIISGTNNEIVTLSTGDTTKNTLIGGSGTGNISQCSRCVLLSTSQCTVAKADNSCIVGGETSSLTSGTECGIFAGSSHTINGSITDSVICGGGQNSITGVSVDECGIFAGCRNSIVGPSGDESVIIGGADNTLNASIGRSGIISGAFHTLNGDRCGIFAGNGHTIVSGTLDSVMLGGEQNSINGSSVTNCVIAGGGNGNITANEVVVLKCNSTSRTYSAANQCYIDAATTIHYGDIDPDTTGSYDIGSSSLRWGNVYAQFGVFGTSTVSIGQGKIFNSTGDLTIETTTGTNIIAGDDTSSISNASDSAILGGSTNTITAATSQSGIFCGSSNTISNTGARAIILSGSSNTINSDTVNQIIIGGSSNSITATGVNNTMISASSGTIQGSGDRNSIYTGHLHNIQDGVGGSTVRSVILGGQNGNIAGSSYSCIIAGISNTMVPPSGTPRYNVIIGGNTNEISNTNTNSGRNVIVGGGVNVIDGTSTDCCIAGGSNHTITNGGDSAVIGGDNATLTSIRTVVLKCNATTRTFSTASQLEVDAGTSVFYGDIDPDTNATHDIGSSSLRWSTIFANNPLDTSDKRLKTDIEDLNYGLVDVLHLRPVKFRWKEGKQPLTKKQYGLIAQEVEEIIPELVIKPTDYLESYIDYNGEQLEGNALEQKQKEREDDYRSINYGSMVPILINCIKELNQKIETQQIQINELLNK